MKKKCIVMMLIILVVTCFVSNIVFADDISDVISNMKDVGKVNNAGGSNMGKILNGIIKLIQIAGSGISVLVVTILGVKYMMASANEKADIKKQAVPIIVGCVLLFAGSNIAGLIADLGVSLNSNTVNNGGSSSTSSKPRELPSSVSGIWDAVKENRKVGN